MDKRYRYRMCAYGSCRVEWVVGGDSGSGPRRYCAAHKIPARKEYDRLRYLALKKTKKMCKTCGLLTSYTYCNRKCYPNYYKIKKQLNNH
jgi:hypothetical protein